MRTVYKYPIKHDLKIPAHAMILKAGTQYGEPFVWVDVDTENMETTIHLQIFGTGHEIPKDAIHVDGYTEVILGKYFEWHVYQVFK